MMRKKSVLIPINRMLLVGLVLVLICAGAGSVQAEEGPPPSTIPDSNPGYTPPPIDLEGLGLPDPDPRLLPSVAVPSEPEGFLWPSSSIVINEFDEIYDQIEFYNMSDTAVNMGLWKLKVYDENGLLDTTYTFPFGFTLGAYDYVVVHEYGSVLGNTATDLYSGMNFWIVSYGGALSLEDNTSWGRDFVRWGMSLKEPPEGTGWAGTNPFFPDFVFFSMGRDAASLDRDYGEDWKLQNSSFGAQNLATLCVELVLNSNGAGALPAASPTQSVGCDPGWYVPGEEILIGADPLPGYEVGQWDESPATEYLGREVLLDYTMSVYHKYLWVSYIQSPPTATKVLLMGLWSNYADALDELGVAYDQLNGYTFAPDWELLNRYDLVIYQTIDDPFIPNLQATSFATYLDEGGCMWVEADSYQAPEIGVPDVLYSYFGINAMGGGVIPGTLSGLGGVFSELGPYIDISGTAFGTLTPENGAEAAFEGGAGDIFGVNKLTEDYLTAFVSFDYNNLSEIDQIDMLERIVEICVPLNDDIDAAFEIPSSNYSNTQHYLAIAAATVADDDPAILPYGPVNQYTVWYSFTPTESATLSVDTFGSDYDTVLGVWTGTRGSLSQVAYNDDNGGFQSKVQFAATAGTTYYFEIAGYDDFEHGTLVITVSDPSLCHLLSLSSSEGGADPTATPENSSGCPVGQYILDEAIELTAVPDSGWEVSGWSGTDDDASTATTNTLTMPDGAHAASVTYVASSAYLMESDFEEGNLLEWSRYNDGGGWLYVCSQGAINGNWGACVQRGDNDKRKQLIDETPVAETTFNARLNFDINSLSMGEGERFRFLQVKWGAERPFFIVLNYSGGVYTIQLNTLLDNLTKVKTAWFVLTNAPHTIEVDWQASSGPGANDGYARLYMDDVLLQGLTGLDNDTLWIDSFRVGFTSRLDGKIITGIFYVDDVATSNKGHIGLP